MFAASRFVRKFSTSRVLPGRLKVAIIGQSQFGAEVYKLLAKNDHHVVGVFTIPDVQGRADPLALAADSDGVPVFKFKSWRRKGQALPEVLQQYQSVGADLNVMPFCSQFIPMEVINNPKHKSICYHPSILPAHRGASAINWTLMDGDKEGGFSIFWADDGLDTGPILLQRKTPLDANETIDSFYNRFLYPEGITALAEAVEMVSQGTAPKITQTEEGATYDKMIKKDVVQINWDQPAEKLHNFIRGNDKVPGAWADVGGEKVTFYGSKMWSGGLPKGADVDLGGHAGLVHDGGLLLFGNDKKAINVQQVQFEDGKMIKGSKYGQAEEDVDIEFTAEELKWAEEIKLVWVSILRTENISDETDFFKSGAGSMEVVRLVEEVKDRCGVELSNDDVYMATTYSDFVKAVVVKSRGGDEVEFTYDAVEMHVNKRDIKFPHQLFINNEFSDASDGATFETFNPNDESVICKVAKGTKEDVDRAVNAAEAAFNDGEWGKMNASDREVLMHKLADLMEECKEELATLETIDSGAVYTLALKTHIGMSINTFRYFAGWCNKIQGAVIPVNHARPNRALTFTRKEPIGVCGIITPWNYPLMMLAWKMASCLAAGNTVVLKPAQVTPLTSLKFAELVVKAGFPPGVINILPGSGSVVGQAIADHPKVRKLGFTGSTPIGQTIMESCAVSNLKKCSLELGGKSPLLIFADCDFDKAVKMGMSSVFFNKGENCIAAGRLFVEESIHDRYVTKVVEGIKKMKIGDPMDRSTDHGPQNHRKHFESLLAYIKTGVDEGATLVYGGRQVDRPGLFLEPTVFTDVEDSMFIAKEESFGPIMIISKFPNGDMEEVLRRANDTEYGLASGVFTSDVSKALRVAEKLQAGTVFVNTYNKTDVASPFGGFKQSGFGKDLGEEALNDYLKTKAVTIEY